MNPINGTRSIQVGRRSFIGMAAGWLSCSLHAQEAGTLPAPRLDDASRPLKVAPTVLAAGSANIVRVRQVLPHDGLQWTETQR